MGKCILPAILLHGIFDFYLFVTAFEYSLSSPSSSQDDTQSSQISASSDDGLYIFLNIGVPLIITAAGLFYYIIESR